MTQSTAPLLLIPGVVILIALYYGWQGTTADRPLRSVGLLVWVVIGLPLVLSIGLHATSNALLVFESGGTDRSGFTIRRCRYFTGRGFLDHETMSARCPNWLKTGG